MIEKQETFNFDPSAPKLKISTIVETMDTSAEIKHVNNQ